MAKFKVGDKVVDRGFPLLKLTVVQVNPDGSYATRSPKGYVTTAKEADLKAANACGGDPACNAVMVEVTCKANGEKTIIPIDEFRKGTKYGGELTGYERAMLGRGIDRLNADEYIYRVVSNATACNELAKGQKVKLGDGRTGTIASSALPGPAGTFDFYHIRLDDGRMVDARERNITVCNAAFKDLDGKPVTPGRKFHPRDDHGMTFKVGRIKNDPRWGVMVEPDVMKGEDDFYALDEIVWVNSSVTSENPVVANALNGCCGTARNAKFKVGDKVKKVRGSYTDMIGTVKAFSPGDGSYTIAYEGVHSPTYAHEEDLVAANACACNWGSYKIGTRVEVDGRKGTIVANPGNLNRYTIKFDDGKTGDANSLAPDFKVINAVCNANPNFDPATAVALKIVKDARNSMQTARMHIGQAEDNDEAPGHARDIEKIIKSMDSLIGWMKYYA